MFKNFILEVKKLNPSFLNLGKGALVKTKLTFPKNWGLRTSSTLINNLAYWAKTNPYQLSENTFGGSGYDIACGQHNTPILYTRNGISPIVQVRYMCQWAISGFSKRIFCFNLL